MTCTIGVLDNWFWESGGLSVLIIGYWKLLTLDTAPGSGDCDSWICETGEPVNDWKLLSTLEADVGSEGFDKLADIVWTVFFLVIVKEGSWAFLLAGIGL